MARSDRMFPLYYLSASTASSCTAEEPVSPATRMLSNSRANPPFFLYLRAVKGEDQDEEDVEREFRESQQEEQEQEQEQGSESPSGSENDHKDYPFINSGVEVPSNVYDNGRAGSTQRTPLSTLPSAVSRFVANLLTRRMAVATNRCAVLVRLSLSLRSLISPLRSVSSYPALPSASRRSPDRPTFCRIDNITRDSQSHRSIPQDVIIQINTEVETHFDAADGDDFTNDDPRHVQTYGTYQPPRF